MSVSHVHSDTTADIGSAVSSQSVTKPTGFTTGDIGVMVVVNEWGTGQTAQASTPSSGWTQIGTTQTATVSTGHVQLSAWWANGSVGAVTVANTQTGSLQQQGIVFSCFAGVDTTTPIDVTPAGSSSTAAATLSVTGVTTVTDQAWDVFASGDWLGGTAETATGFTISENGHANAPAVFAYNTTPKSIGATGSVTLNAASGSTQIIVAIRFALRPAGAAAAWTPPGANPGLPPALLAMRHRQPGREMPTRRWWRTTESGRLLAPDLTIRRAA